jgi:glutaredoxin
MQTLILYTTEGCHLCEFAEQMLVELRASKEYQLESIDISTDEALVEVYGIRIPVVKNKQTDKEIGWPFQLEQLEELLNSF